MNQLKNIVLVQLDVNLWSAHCKLDPEELLQAAGADATELHRALASAPSEVVSLGSKRIFPQESLTKFGSLKYHAEKLLRLNGFRSFRAFVLPASKYPEIKRQLQDYKREFDALRSQFLATYDSTLEAWAKQYPEWQDAIMRAAPKAERVYDQLGFRFSAFHIAPVSADAETDVGDGGMVRSLADELMDEAIAEAQSFYDDCLKQKDHVNRVSLKRLSELGEKLDGFRFIDTRIGPLADKLTSIVNSVPAKGKIVGRYYDAVNSVVLTILSGHALDYASGKVDEEDAEVSVADDAVEAQAPLIEAADEADETEDSDAEQTGWLFE